MNMVADPELDELKREFLAEANEKAEEMQSAESLERIAYLAHQLKGAGGSYGYEVISSEAAEIEKLAESGDGGAAGIRTHVARLREEIEKRAAELA
jgi:HPt (histidine-containing phosphotransfer) domain-containing protein